MNPIPIKKPSKQKLFPFLQELFFTLFAIETDVFNLIFLSKITYDLISKGFGGLANYKPTLILLSWLASEACFFLLWRLFKHLSARYTSNS